MRFCLTCNRLGAGVDACVRDKSVCKIVDRGHRIRSRDDLAGEVEEGDLIDDVDAARGRPNDGDAAPQVELPAPAY